MEPTTTPIEDYALLADGQTAALVSPSGSVDWLCLPAFDSPACFAALLGTPEHGRWLLGPEGEATTTRRYLGDSWVLETVHTTSTGSVRVIDLMPGGDDRVDLLRRVEGISGEVTMRHEWRVRTWYGSRRPWVREVRGDLGEVTELAAIAGPDAFRLHGPHLPVQDDVCTFTVRAGETLDLDMVWAPSTEDAGPVADVGTAIDRALAEATAWIAPFRYDGPHPQAVRRSLVLLRALTDERTGGIVAAPTTSLPEEMGGERNWDYRFCWLRDSALTLEALIRCGYVEDAQPWRQWLLRAIAGDPRSMQIMYTVDGGIDLPERTLGHLPGYAASRPVRIGNGAVGQRQTDVLGELMAALFAARQAGLPVDEHSWALQVELVEQLCEHWDEPDNGLWEIRGPLRHFTHSRVMVWVALDRAVRSVRDQGLPGDAERWAQVRDRIRAEVLERGVDPVRGAFRQHYETDDVDASLLTLATVGFIEPDDPRFLATVAAVEEDLVRDGLVLRYRTASGVDGLAGDEHPFLLCCFWLVSAYARCGRLADAEAMLDRLVGLTSELGLLAEESDPRGRFAGNFPQAFSHLGLVMAALDVAEARAAC